MSTSKHGKSGPLDRPRNDMIDNPGIGTTKGSNAGKFDPAQEERDSTFEGDVMNDTTPQGGVDPDQRGRTNR